MDRLLLEAVSNVGFEHPTPIQVGVIPPTLEGTDVIGLAETGSGKTAAFCLPMIQHLHAAGPKKYTRGLVLCPTREIALQTTRFLESIAETVRFNTATLIGGVKYPPQISALEKGADIIVATPGRLLDHMKRRNARLDRVEWLVMDEADHMLDLGFLPQILAVLEELPRKRQTLMFSATMPSTVGRLAGRFMRDPIQVDLRPDHGAAEGISHRLFLVEVKDKKPCLLALARDEPGSMLVFLRRKIDAEWACRQLEIEGHPVDRIHSDRSQGQRVAALEGFREGDHRILVATDIAARGLDIPRIKHIVNFDPPGTVEDYIHRAGRTARGKAEGIVSTIATWRDKPFVKELEKTLGQSIERCQAAGVESYTELKPPKSRIRRRLL